MIVSAAHGGGRLSGLSRALDTSYERADGHILGKTTRQSNYSEVKVTEGEKQESLANKQKKLLGHEDTLTPEQFQEFIAVNTGKNVDINLLASPDSVMTSLTERERSAQYITCSQN